MTANTILIPGLGHNATVDSGGNTELIGGIALKTQQTSSHTGDFDVTEIADTFSASGYSTHLAVMATTEADDTCSITGYVGIYTTSPIGITEAPDLFAGAGPGHPPGLFASADMIELDDVLDGTVSVPFVGTMGGDGIGAIEAKDVFAGRISNPKQFTMTLTEAKDVFHGVAFTVGSSGTMASTEAKDTMHGVGFTVVTAEFNRTELADRFRAAAPGVITYIRRQINVS